MTRPNRNYRDNNRCPDVFHSYLGAGEENSHETWNGPRYWLATHFDNPNVGAIHGDVKLAYLIIHMFPSSMQQLSETSFQPFLGKEWLVKVNSASSTPYLFKLASSTIDLKGHVLFTDTKSVWTEEITSQQLARRWRQCNSQAPPPFANLEDEDEWRSSILDLLAKAHTLGGINELSFELVDSHYSDLAFQLECGSFKWRWETCYVGHKLSSEIISKQLILPLIGTNHLLSSSTEPVQNMTDGEVENAVDRIGRTARRSIDTHVKNSLSKPRISTVLRRMTAVFNSLHELPSITSTADEPDLRVPAASTKALHDSRPTEYTVLSSVVTKQPISHSPIQSSPSRHRKSATPLSSAKADSATESSADEREQNTSSQPPNMRSHRSVSPKFADPSRASSTQKRSLSPILIRTKTPEKDRDQTSDDDSSPVKPPSKKAKAALAVSDDSDSELERKVGGSQAKGNGGGFGMGGGRGPRQPVKRGGRKF